MTHNESDYIANPHWAICPDCGVWFIANSEAEIKCLVCMEKEEKKI